MAPRTLAAGNVAWCDVELRTQERFDMTPDTYLLERILEELEKINAGLTQLVEYLPCKQNVGSAILSPGSIETEYCPCGACSLSAPKYGQRVTDIASDIDPEILNHGRCIR